MGFGEFFLGSNNKKLNLNFEGKIKRESFKGDVRLLKIFYFFDQKGDGNGALETYGNKGNEIGGMLSFLKNYSQRNHKEEGEALLDYTEAHMMAMYIGNKICDATITAEDVLKFWEMVELSKVKITQKNTKVGNNGEYVRRIDYEDLTVKEDTFSLQYLEQTRSAYVADKDSASRSGREVVGKYAGTNEDKILPEIVVTPEQYCQQAETPLAVVEYGEVKKLELESLADYQYQMTQTGIAELLDMYFARCGDGCFARAGLTLTGGDIAQLKNILLKAKSGNSPKLKQDNYYQIEQFLPVAQRYQNARAVKSRIEFLKQGLKELRALVLSTKKEITSHGMNTGVDTTQAYKGSKIQEKLLEILTAYFFGNREYAEAFEEVFFADNISTDTFNVDVEKIIETLELTTEKHLKEAIPKEFNKAKEWYPEKSDAELLDIAFDYLEKEYNGRYERVYGEKDPTVLLDKRLGYAQQATGYLQLGTVIIAQTIVGMITMGTGNATLQTLMGSKLGQLAFLAGCNYGVKLLNEATSSNGLTAGRAKELAVEEAYSLPFLAFAIYAAGPAGEEFAKYIKSLKIEPKFLAQAGIQGGKTQASMSLSKFYDIVSKNNNFLAQAGKFTLETGMFGAYDLALQNSGFGDAMQGAVKMQTEMKVLGLFAQYLTGQKFMTAIKENQFKTAIDNYTKRNNVEVQIEQTAKGTKYKIVDLKNPEMPKFETTDFSKLSMFVMREVSNAISFDNIKNKLFKEENQLKSANDVLNLLGKEFKDIDLSNILIQKRIVDGKEVFDVIELDERLDAPKSIDELHNNSKSSKTYDNIDDVVSHCLRKYRLKLVENKLAEASQNNGVSPLDVLKELYGDNLSKLEKIEELQEFCFKKVDGNWEVIQDGKVICKLANFEEMLTYCFYRTQVAVIMNEFKGKSIDYTDGVEYTGAEVEEDASNINKTESELKPASNEELETFANRIKIEPDNINQAETKQHLLKIAETDIDLAETLQKQGYYISKYDIEEITEAVKIDKNLTLELLSMTRNKGVKARLLGKKAEHLIYHMSDVLNIVKAAQENYELTMEVINFAKQNNLNTCDTIPNVVRLAAVDKDLALKLYKQNNKMDDTDAINYINALKLNREQTLTLIAIKDRYNNHLSSKQVASIVHATIKSADFMNGMYDKLTKKEISINDYVDISYAVNMLGGDFAYKTVDELTPAQKRILLNKISSLKTRNGRSKIIDEIFPCLPETTDTDAIVSLINRLTRELNSKPEKVSNERIAKLNSIIENLFIKADKNSIKSLIEEFLPEYKDIIDDKILSNATNMINRIVKNKDFIQLSNNDKKITVLSSILSNCRRVGETQNDTASEAYKSALKLGFDEYDANKIYSIVKSANLIEQFMATSKSKINHNFDSKYDITNRTFVFLKLAFELKEGNTFELARLVYSSIEQAGFTRHLDNLLKKKINEIKADDFVLYQTPTDEYKSKAHKETLIGASGKRYDVMVVNSDEIENFYAIGHNPDGISFIKGDCPDKQRFAKMLTLGHVTNDRAYCGFFMNGENICAIKDGFIFVVPNDKFYIGSGHDIGSSGKSVDAILKEYFIPNDVVANTHDYSGAIETKNEERQMVSRNLKAILNISNEEYIKRLDNIKSRLRGEPFTPDNIRPIDREFADAYEEFFSRVNHDGTRGKDALLSDGEWNEVIFSNPKIAGIYTTDLSKISENMLIFAEDNNIPIVVLKPKTKNFDTETKPEVASTPKSEAKTKTGASTKETTSESKPVSAHPEQSNEYPSLSLIDAVTKRPGSDNVFYGYTFDVKLNNPKVQQQVSDYLDKLLECIPEDVEGDGNSLRQFADFILPDGTAIARNLHGKEKVKLTNGNPDGFDWTTDDKVALWIKDVNGVEHILPCLTPENAAKAQRICNYMATLTEIPRNKIDDAQRRVLNGNSPLPQPYESPTLTHTSLQTVLRNGYTKSKTDIDNSLDEGGLAGVGRFSSRIKGNASLTDKITNYIAKHPNATLEDIVNECRDVYGGRTRIAPADLKNHPIVKRLIAEGNLTGAIQKAAEIQSEPLVDLFRAMIDEIAAKHGDLEIIRISNYVSPDGIPYLSEDQLRGLATYAAEKGVKFEYNELVKEGDEMWDAYQNGDYTPTTRSQPSGYTALQINFKTKDGKVIEWQYRGEIVDRFAEAEHLPYDLRTGKRPWEEIPELEGLYKPIADMLDKNVMEKEIYQEYNRYLGDYYKYLRAIELGFELPEPQLKDYNNGQFDKRLEAKNLILLHEITDKFKRGEYTLEEMENAYNGALKYNGGPDTSVEGFRLGATKEILSELNNILDRNERQFSIVQKTQIKEEISNNPAKFGAFTQMLNIKGLTEAQIVQLLSSQNIPIWELNNIGQYAKDALNQGFDIVSMMESTEADFENWVKDETRRIEAHEPKTPDKPTKVRVTESAKDLVEQLRRLKKEKFDERLIYELTKDEVKKASLILSGVENLDGFITFRFIEIVKDYTIDDIELIQAYMNSACLINKPEFEKMINAIGDNSAKRYIAIEMLKISKDYREYVKENPQAKFSSILNNEYLIQDLIEIVDNKEQADAILYYINSENLDDLRISFIRNNIRLLNSIKTIKDVIDSKKVQTTKLP